MTTDTVRLRYIGGFHYHLLDRNGHLLEMFSPDESWREMGIMAAIHLLTEVPRGLLEVDGTTPIGRAVFAFVWMEGEGYYPAVGGNGILFHPKRVLQAVEELLQDDYAGRQDPPPPSPNPRPEVPDAHD